MAGRLCRSALIATVLALVAPVLAAAAFPGADPAESPRVNTPNDPEFDRCELDDPDSPVGDCDTYWEEQFGAFGFSPDSANEVPAVPHSVGATRYDDCSQLDARGRRANLQAGDPECAQIAGVRADLAWKYSAGDPETVIAILDTGIRWQEEELVEKVHLNAGELPTPRTDRGAPLAGGAPCSSFVAADDANGDGAFNVVDFACDPRVAIDAGDEEADALLDGSDLIAGFSDGGDDDANRYVDDIAGWDFFDDDNDPFDASSCCSANGHGTGRAGEAAAATDNGEDGAGMCPRCQIMPLRVWDTFVVPTDNFALALLYAAQNRAGVAEGAVGGLTNTLFARGVFRYADQRGLALMMVSSDINSANHNYPTNYNEAVYVAGSLPDSAPNDTCSGPGGLPGIGDVGSPPDGFAQGCQELLGLLSEEVGVNPSLQPQTTSFFRNSNLTQYGGKADIVLMGSTGSQNTGQAAGAAALLASYGREVFGDDDPLSGNEIRQLLTMTAEDVLPANTGEIGAPFVDKANAGWDSHFGYGRVNLAAAMQRIEDRRIPPEAQLDGPDWFTPINVDRVPASGVQIRGRAAAPHSAAGVGAWEVEYACGQDAADSDFEPVPGASGSGAVDGPLGSLPRELLVELASECDGAVQNDAGRPAGTAAEPWPADPYPAPDPERHAFQIRLTVHEAGDAANIGRYRKTLFAYRDDGNLEGWPRPVGSGSDAGRHRTGSGGETSPRLYDVDGDNELDVLLPTSSGELHVLHADGSPVESFHDGRPVRTGRYALERNHPVPAGLPRPRESLRVPAIGDIDGDRSAEIVATAGEHVYAWNLDGSRQKGFPVGVDRALSDPCDPGAPHPCLDADERAITSENHIKRGFVGSPALADLDGDRRLDIVVGALDQHLYAWTGKGRTLAGFPAKLASEGADGAEIVTSPAIADLDGDEDPEVIVATNEVIGGDPQFPTNLFDVFNALLASSTGANPVYALHGDGSAVEGWPVGVGVAAGDLLPLVLPGHDSAVIDADGDGDDEVSVSAATSLAGAGGSRLVDGDGSTILNYENAVTNGADQGPILNLADYASIGDLTGQGPAVVKGGLTLNGAANLLAVNQNLPFHHVEQAWDLGTGAALPGYPRATDDFQLLSQASIARVGPGSGRQALVGTGLYQLHAYGPAGAEPAGWPKFTGGWLQVTPAVGDADGDRDLDVAALTREGWSFLWDTGVPACGGANDEWWTFHHDEHSWANYGHDARPPGTARRIRIRRVGNRAVRAKWTTPGGDWMCGRSAGFRVLAAKRRIDSPTDGRVVLRSRRPRAAGERVRRRIPGARLRAAKHIAVLYRDDARNWGQLAAKRLPRRPGGGRPGGGGGRCAKTISGGPEDDRLSGRGGSDRIFGRAGRDSIRGRAGADCLRGGNGRDRIRGGSGRDRLDGGKGRDVIRGGSGRDRIRPSPRPKRSARAPRGAGRDRVACGGGRDVVVLHARARLRGCERVKRRY